MCQRDRGTPAAVDRCHRERRRHSAHLGPQHTHAEGTRGRWTPLLRGWLSVAVQGIIRVSEPATAVAFHPSGNRLAIGLGTGEVCFLLSRANCAGSLTSPPHPKIIVVQTDTMTVLCKSTYRETPVRDLKFSPDGGMVAAVHPDGRIDLYSSAHLEFLRACKCKVRLARGCCCCLAHEGGNHSCRA
jgi:hypothetical protein